MIVTDFTALPLHTLTQQVVAHSRSINKHTKSLNSSTTLRNWIAQVAVIFRVIFPYNSNNNNSNKSTGAPDGMDVLLQPYQMSYQTLLIQVQLAESKGRRYRKVGLAHTNTAFPSY